MSFAIGNIVQHNKDGRKGKVTKVTKKMCNVNWEPDGINSRASKTSLSLIEGVRTPTVVKKTRDQTTTGTTRQRKKKTTTKQPQDTNDGVSKKLNYYDQSSSTESTDNVSSVIKKYPYESAAFLSACCFFISYLMKKYSFVVLASLAAFGILYYKNKPAQITVTKKIKKREKKKKKKVIVSETDRNIDEVPLKPPAPLTTRKAPKQRTTKTTQATKVNSGKATMPTPHTSDGKLSTKAFNYPLYGENNIPDQNIKKGEPDHGDVVQGALNNCWCCCGMMMLGRSYKKELMNCVKDLGDGKYEITLYGVDRNGAKNAAESIIVDNKFYHNRSEPYYARCPTGRGETALWPMLLEKALVILVSRAQQKEPSYTNLDPRKSSGKGDKGGDCSYGSATDMVRFVTKKGGLVQPVEDGHFGTIWKDLNEAVNNGQACSAGTKGTKKIANQTLVSKELIYENHMYLVLDANQDDDGKYISLYNPHNRGKGSKNSVKQNLRTRTEEIGTSGSSAVKFKCYEDDFVKSFQTYEIVNR